MGYFHGEQGVWDVETGKQIEHFDQHAAGSVFAADFSPDGRQLLTSNDGPRPRCGMFRQERKFSTSRLIPDGVHVYFIPKGITATR